MPSKDIEELQEISKQYNLFIVEDAAESLGSFYKGIHTGNFSDIGVFSFNGNKIITTGGGGMLVTNKKKYARKAKQLLLARLVTHIDQFTISLHIITECQILMLH